MSSPIQVPTWVVKVELASESLGLLLRGEDSVEGVLAQNGHLPLAMVKVILAQQLHDLAAHCRLHRVGWIKATSVEKLRSTLGFPWPVSVFFTSKNECFTPCWDSTLGTAGVCEKQLLV